MLKSVEDINLNQNRVVLRADLDVDINNGQIEDDTRLQTVIPTLKYLLDNGADKIIVLGHRGRPEGKPSEKLSLKLLIPYFNSRLENEMLFIPYDSLDEFYTGHFFDSNTKIYLLENLRFWSGEEENNIEFAEKISPQADVYVNEAFSVSHREHASIVALPKLIKEKRSGTVTAGLHFKKEVMQLSRAREKPKRPVVVVMGGAKEDKIVYIEKFESYVDKVLVGGRLPLFLPEDLQDPQVIIARLNPDKCDITLNSAERFAEEISKAGTVILNGPMGKYEEEGQMLGTQKVFQAVADSSAYKVGGGGDTEHALEILELKEKMDWISVGGGASLDFLADGSLPGIAVLE